MAYVVYEISSTRIVRSRPWGKEYYATEAAAKAAITRHVKSGAWKMEELQVSDSKAYHMFIENTVERVNLLTGKTYREKINTPDCCSPSSEVYWSM